MFEGVGMVLAWVALVGKVEVVVGLMVRGGGGGGCSGHGKREKGGSSAIRWG